MTQEEKAKAYDEAIERAKSWYINAQIDSKKSLEDLFPELKELEGERIRKALIDFLSDLPDSDTFRGIPPSKIIAWLEKQDEQKSTEKIEPKFKKGDIIRLKHGDGLEWIVEDLHKDGYYTIVNSDKDDFIKLDDNWEIVNKCEEDEDMRYKATAVINRLCAEGKEYVWSINTLKKLLDWLKSLKPQNKNTWKPSDEQMRAFNLMIIAGHISSVKQVQELTNLYKDLKKLKEE